MTRPANTSTETLTLTLSAKDVKKDDLVETMSGSWKRVSSVTPGMIRGHALISWGSGGDEWSSAPREALVEVRRPCS